MEERAVVEPAIAPFLDSNAENEQPNQSAYPFSPIDWTDLVRRIHLGEDSGMEELYKLFARGIRFYLCRQLGPQELDDKVHDTFLIVVQAIRRGEIREPERLMGFVRTVVRRQVAAHIDQIVHSRRDELNIDVGVRIADRRRNPEQAAVFHQKVEFMTEVLASLSERDREILTRFYLHEESQEQVCEEMNLSETQFRLLKSRAKARFGEIGKRKLQQKPLAALFVRTSELPGHSSPNSRSRATAAPSA
ncbi:MAG TPA: sigma-70 family RNA polymerase sigma factor [Bryobacteraceae bacterium]|nr:sigma-70 family RNA polymerase sigma factor [Bryobacteraceae bacterium]